MVTTKIKIIFCIVFIGIQTVSFSQNDTVIPPVNTVIVNVDSVSAQNAVVPKINYKRVGVIASIVPLSVVGVYVYMHNAWWKYEKAPFHFQTDLGYALNLDKCGHFYSSYGVTMGFSDILQWAGLPKRKSLWWGATLSILNSTIVEYKDGVARDWGFSMYDELANVTGSLYPVLQEYVPFLQNFNFKWSFDFFNKSVYMSIPDKKNKIFMDDYDSHTYWLTIDAARLFFPNKKHSAFPYFIDAAIGLSANGINGDDDAPTGVHEWYFGLDINITKLVWKNTPTEKIIKKYLNLYHIPMPSLLVSPKVKFNWLML